MRISAYEVIFCNDEELNIIVNRVAFDNIIQQKFMEKSKDRKGVMLL